MEILSPAGNMAALISAVRSGADAVYLGLKDFSARRNAENFSFAQLSEAVEYCHIRGVKVYVTLNTMIKQSEIQSAVQCAAGAYNRGVDAFIVSDLGLISVLRERLPQAVLHASTQMTVHSPAALKPLKKLGIKRVVLAREMSREEIKEFCAAAADEGIETEVFVHGALCMCVSGQCLLSSVLGGRSGNRGLCAGPCRLEFSAGKSGRYDLSLKDLSLLDYLSELKEFGVSSVKIEGRMKRPEYVAAATAACRGALYGEEDSNLKTALKGVFSRSGFTDGYYTSRLGADMFGIRTKEDVQNSGDTFAFLHSLYKNERQSVAINLSAFIKANENITLFAEDNLGNRVTVTGEIPQAAKSKATDSETVKSALLKLGGTPYYAAEIRTDIEDGLFVSISELNRLRREAIKLLSKKRAALCRAEDAVYKVGSYTAKRCKPKIYARFLSPDRMPADISGIDAVILPCHCDFPALPEDVLKICELPRYITDETLLKNRLTVLRNRGVEAACCQNLASITLALEAGLKVITSIGFNCDSSESIAALKSLGADEVLLSAETNMSEAVRLGGAPKGIFAYGRLPLMLTRNCPVKNVKTCKECGKNGVLRDRKGVLFPVVCSKDYSEVLNCAPVYLGDKREDLLFFDFLVFYFTDEDSAAAREILDKYAEGLPADFPFTRGLYYRNLL